MASPYNIREEVYRKLFPAEKALVKIAALMMLGRTLIPARLMAMTYGLERRKVRSGTREKKPEINSPLSSVTSGSQQCWIVIRYKHASDQGTENLRTELSVCGCSIPQFALGHT